MIILITLLFFEYRFFCHHVKELVAAQKQYNCYISILQKKLAIDSDIDDELAVDFQEEEDSSGNTVMTLKELSIASAQASDAPDDDDNYIDESFVLINRQPEYLKQSTMEYVKSQKIDSLATAIDIDQWSDCTDQKIVPVQEEKPAIIDPVKPKIKSQLVKIRKPIKDFDLIWPIDKDKFWLSSLFGARKRIDGTWGFHHGIDMAAIKGTAIKAARGGRVIESSFQSGYGNTVVLQHTADIKTRYAHLNAIRVRVGQVVKSGVIVGTVGETGFIRKKGKNNQYIINNNK